MEPAWCFCCDPGAPSIFATNAQCHLFPCVKAEWKTPLFAPILLLSFPTFFVPGWVQYFQKSEWVLQFKEICPSRGTYIEIQVMQDGLLTKVLSLVFKSAVGFPLAKCHNSHHIDIYRNCMYPIPLKGMIEYIEHIPQSRWVLLFTYISVCQEDLFGTVYSICHNVLWVTEL